MVWIQKIREDFKSPDVYYARYVIKGEKDIKKNHDYTILRQVFDMAREGGDDWVEDRFYKGKKIE